MSLDPQARLLLDQIAQGGVAPFHTLTPQQARDQMMVASRFLGPAEEVHSVEDREVPGPNGTIPIRLYRPSERTPLPAAVFFHGGCWVMGSIRTHDGYCRAVANRTGAIVVSVDYRLAPEHKYPAAAEDAFAATSWVSEQAATIGVDPGRIAVMGDSAGGNLAAVVALMARDRDGPPLAFQLLVYPITEFNFDTPSYRENGTGFHLTREIMVWCWNHYLSNELEAYQPYASPSRADDLGNLPPAWILTAEYDPLRDEGETYARKLQDAGVPVTLKRYEGMIHGFTRRTDLLDKAREALDDVSTALREAFGTPADAS
ncbi:MAG: alpha/beta hydrolase [Planctomycetes bacterium]|nr:alpha/beta hydrolase [Planctomycetota bacterium]